MPSKTPLPVEPASDQEELTNLLQVVQQALGVDFSRYKMATIRRRAFRRMAIRNLTTLQDYGDYVRRNPGEIHHLCQDILINVTSFFRDADTMDYLATNLLPELIRGKDPQASFRLWVPACSTGEEVYSLAMLLIEAFEEQNKPLTIQIFATDLSERVIRQARTGYYTSGQLAGVSAGRLRRFFTPERAGYRISHVVRGLCTFAPHNVFFDPPFSRLDLISCRNLLIYTDTFLQQKAITTFHYALDPKGYLLLGKAETVRIGGNLFRQVQKAYKIFARDNDWRTPGFTPDLTASWQKISVDQPSPSSVVSSPETTWPDKTTHPAMTTNDPAEDDINQCVDTLLNEYIPASVVIDEAMKILVFRGATGLFLESAPGRATFSLLKMARPELVLDLRRIIRKARQSGKSVAKTGIQIRVREQFYQVDIRAIPFRTKEQESLVLIVFEEIPLTKAGPDEANKYPDQRIEELEEELDTLRDDMRLLSDEHESSTRALQTANEEIISSNEELQSTNEELQSTNEELETSKEEIQSNNEELQAINQELQAGNELLMAAYDYSDVIFSTIREAVLVLDEDLRVYSANRAFYKLFRVDPTDTVACLLYELGNHQWDIPALRQLLDRVIQYNEQIQGFEIAHYFPELGEKILRVYARKIVRQQGQEAILLAIEDITDHKQVQRLLEYLQSVLIHAPVLIQLFKAVRTEGGTIIDFQLIPLDGATTGPGNKPAGDMYKTSYNALYGDSRPRDLFAQFVQVVETGESMRVETPDDRTGDDQWNLVTASRFDDGFLLVTSHVNDSRT